MKTALTTILGMIAGLVLFYELGAILGCDIFWRESNLCGLPSMLFAAPAGLVGGGILAARLSRRRAKAKPDAKES